jgi:hypothetical protein
LKINIQHLILGLKVLDYWQSKICFRDDYFLQVDADPHLNSYGWCLLTVRQVFKDVLQIDFHDTHENYSNHLGRVGRAFLEVFLPNIKNLKGVSLDIEPIIHWLLEETLSPVLISDLPDQTQKLRRVYEKIFGAIASGEITEGMLK